MKQEDFQALSDSQKLEEIYKSVEKTRKYIKLTVIVTVVVIVLPLIFLPFAISNLFNAYDLTSLGL